MGKVGDNVVGTILKRGLSGGEKRRTSVGQELVVRQALAFLDEPTSGLDGTAAYDVIKVSPPASEGAPVSDYGALSTILWKRSSPFR